MPNSTNPEAYQQASVLSSDGHDVGRVVQLFLDNASGQPTWASVVAGALGTREAFVPLDGADLRDGQLHVPFTQAQIHQAPAPAAAHELSPADEEMLLRHYGLSGAAPQQATGGFDNAYPAQAGDNTLQSQQRYGGQPGQDSDGANPGPALTESARAGELRQPFGQQPGAVTQDPFSGDVRTAASVQQFEGRMVEQSGEHPHDGVDPVTASGTQESYEHLYGGPVEMRNEDRQH